MSTQDRKQHTGGADRRQRLSEQLRANLRRRKEQMRQRAHKEAGEASQQDNPPQAGERDK